MVLMAIISAMALVLLRTETPLLAGLPGQMALGFLNVLTGALVGAVYALTVNMEGRSKDLSPGTLFSADLTGAALGTLLPVVFLLPLIGVMNTFILFIGINISTAIRLMYKSKEIKHG
jgi:predicted membrane-bound spermidine synthase